MHIRMYNCYFGDCFKIENSNGNDLLVDFGIHPLTTIKVNREKRFDEIHDDIKSEKLDFLLSHYHVDHYNGVVYVNDKFGYKFEDVYIPDIWKTPAVSVHLLQILLERSILYRKTTLFSFLKAICKDHSIIHLIQRGRIIQKQYIALWPTGKYVADRAKTLLADIQDDYSFSDSDKENLTNYSNKLIQIVQVIESGDYQGDTMIVQINELEEEFLNHEWEFGSKKLPRGVLYKLRDFGNDISIVFQNREDNKAENLLFTGDFGEDEDLWDFIESNDDKLKYCDMHRNYRVIKVGHHGTRDYYHSYVEKIDENSNLFIPNDGETKNWNISSDYSLNAVTHDVHVVCSTANACEARINNKGVCTCTKRDIIDSGVCLDIT